MPDSFKGCRYWLRVSLPTVLSCSHLPEAEAVRWVVVAAGLAVVGLVVGLAVGLAVGRLVGAVPPPVDPPRLRLALMAFSIGQDPPPQASLWGAGLFW